MTYLLHNTYAVTLPLGLLDIPPFRPRPPPDAGVSLLLAGPQLADIFATDGGRDPLPTPAENTRPSITNNGNDFVACCENLLTLRSFFNYGGEHCPSAMPWKDDGSFNKEAVEECTKLVAESLKNTVNRGEGTNGWAMPKFLDMLNLPDYMSRLGSTGRFHVGFAERGLKNWAKKPARTAQKRGGGVFEGQCSKRIRERSMMDHALIQMDSDDEQDDGIGSSADPGAGAVGGSCYHVTIGRVGPANSRAKMVTCRRLDSRRRPHRLQNDFPTPIMDHFKRTGRIGDVFELRTEARIGGVLYRAHPNFRGEGPWYDYVNVEFELENQPDYELYVNDKQTYPAKLVVFFRLLPDPEFQVLAHCGEFQAIASTVHTRRSLLTRCWLHEVTAGRNPLPLHRTVGYVKDNIHVKGHVKAVEETPGFLDRYPTDESRRFIVPSDMRKVWPSLFIALCVDTG